MTGILFGYTFFMDAFEMKFQKMIVDCLYKRLRLFSRSGFNTGKVEFEMNPYLFKDFYIFYITIVRLK